MSELERIQENIESNEDERNRCSKCGGLLFTKTLETPDMNDKLVVIIIYCSTCDFSTTFTKRVIYE